MNDQLTSSGEAGRGLGAAPCSASNLRLPNDTKIKFGNAFKGMQDHLGDCEQCLVYLYAGDGDLCDKGKDIIARELSYADTTPDWRAALPEDHWRRLMPR